MPAEICALTQVGTRRAMQIADEGRAGDAKCVFRPLRCWSKKAIRHHRPTAAQNHYLSERFQIAPSVSDCFMGVTLFRPFGTNWVSDEQSYLLKVAEFQIFKHRQSLGDPLALFLIGQKIASSPQTLTDVWRKGDEPSNRNRVGPDSGAEIRVRPESEL
jgi:hypothetical protein